MDLGNEETGVVIGFVYQTNMKVGLRSIHEMKACIFRILMNLLLLFYDILIIVEQVLLLINFDFASEKCSHLLDSL